MGKKPALPDESHLVLPAHKSFTPQSTPIVDTHTHVLSTYEFYKSKYKEPKYATLSDFVRGLYGDSTGTRHKVEKVVDVWCEAPVLKDWRELADNTNWGNVKYSFVMGVHPHHAKTYTDEVEADILEAMKHPRCVGWGEIGLDYHYKFSEIPVQREVFARQLRQAVKLGKPITLHTREAEADTEEILKAIVPQDHSIHVHCYTDSPELAYRLLNHFSNLYIGVTGVITYASNENTSAVIKQMVDGMRTHHPTLSSLRIVLETDAPYMVPSNLYPDLPKDVKGRLPLSHPGMIPWTAQWVADVAGEGWDAEKVLKIASDNATKVYGI